MNDTELQRVSDTYSKIRDTFSHSEVSTILSMIATLNKEWELREEIEEYNREMQLHNSKMSWNKSFVPKAMLPVPPIGNQVAPAPIQAQTEPKPSTDPKTVTKDDDDFPF